MVGGRTAARQPTPGPSDRWSHPSDQWLGGNPGAALRRATPSRDTAMVELHLVGTLAHDPDGLQRLSDLLEAVRPDVVAVEASRRAFERQASGGDEASTSAVGAITAKGA